MVLFGALLGYYRHKITVALGDTSSGCQQNGDKDVLLQHNYQRQAWSAHRRTKPHGVPLQVNTMKSELGPTAELTTDFEPQREALCEISAVD